MADRFLVITVLVYGSNTRQLQWVSICNDALPHCHALG
jgi:hypothetical protein